MSLYFWVMLGGALGTAGRFALSGFAAQHWGETFPWGTLIINISGSFVIGFFAALTGPDGCWLVNSTGRQFFLVGICGGYTTFSSFSLQTLNLARNSEWLLAGGNVLGSCTLCLIAVWLGHSAAMLINNAR